MRRKQHWLEILVKWIQSVRVFGISDLNFLSHFRLKCKIEYFIKAVLKIYYPPRLKMPFGGDISLTYLCNIYEWDLRSWSDFDQTSSKCMVCQHLLLASYCKFSVQLRQIRQMIASVRELITRTCYMMLTPLKPHFYIVKLGFTRVYIIFITQAQKHRLWVLVRTTSPRRF